MHRNDMEIDFLISNDSKTSIKVFPIEVKSSKNYSTTSYNLFKERFGKRIARSYVVHLKQFELDADGVKTPPYMFFFMLQNGL